ncbi:MAG: enoyl-CoA hydratase/isomerase family protein [Bdellovibrionota bacterium]
MIHTQLKDDVATLGLDFAPCNEIGPQFLEELTLALDWTRTNEAKAVVIHSQRKEGYCAGADLRKLHSEISRKDPQEYLDPLKSFLVGVHHIFSRLDQLPIPVVTAVHGLCFGGGFELALTADVVVAETSARFAFPELRLGLIPCFGGIPRLKREVGNAIIRDILFTGRSINAEKAKEMGWVGHVTKEGKGLAMAQSIAKQMTKFDAHTFAQAKNLSKEIFSWNWNRNWKWPCTCLQNQKLDRPWKPLSPIRLFNPIYRKESSNDNHRASFGFSFKKIFCIKEHALSIK